MTTLGKPLRVSLEKVMTSKVYHLSALAAVMIVAAIPAIADAAEPPPSADLGALLSANADFAKVCRLPGTDISTRDWSTWQGEQVNEDPAQLLEIAERYAGGSAEVRRDKVVARRLLEYLVKTNSKVTPEAQWRLALLLIDPEAGQVESPRAVSLLNTAARSGVVGALISLGEIHERGLFVPPDTAAAARYYQQAAAAGDADGALSVLRMYREGLLEPPTPQVIDQLTMIAFTMLFSEIGAGDCSGLRKIAELYGTEGSPLYDTSKAVSWYEAAVKMRDVDAAMSLANAYRLGVGVEFDNGRALELLNMAASEGSARAMRTIGEIHLYGEGIVGDHKVALYWLEQAARSNDANALAVIAQINRGDFGGTPNQVLYVEALERLAKLPNRKPKVLVELARALLQGTPKAGDPSRSKELLEEAANLGETDAFIDLAALSIAEGEAVEQPAGVARALELQAQEPAPPPSTIQSTYLIERGDSLSVIGRKFNVSVEALIEANDLKSTVIISGHSLKIPPTSTGETADLVPNPITATIEPESKAVVSEQTSRGVTAFPRSSHPASGFVRARSYLRSAANAGNGEAMRVMSSLYECGIGLDPDPELASRWLERAAAAGDVVSLKQLAAEDTSAQGRMGLLKAAAWRGDRESMIDLSVAYRLREAGRSSAQLSAYWRARALAPGPGRNAALVRLARAEYQLAKNDDDVQRVVNMLTEAAFDGEQRANVDLAKMLLLGAEGLKADPERAIAMLVQSANSGSIEAAKSLSELPAELLATSGRDALAWLERAAGQDDTGAMIQLASLAKDERTAIAWVARVQDQNICDADLMVRLAEILGGRSILPPNQQRAAYWLNRASQMLHRSPATNFRIAMAFSNGVGGAADLQTSAQFLVQAADGGDPEALRHLGVQRIGDARELSDWKSALALFDKARGAGDEKAAIDLMDAIYTRKDVPPEILSAAITSLQQTAAAGSARAMREFGLVLQAGTGIDADAPAGADWLRKAAEEGDVIAMRELGRAYRSGFGVSLDPKESVYWIKRAAEQGDQKAMQELASAYRIGFGVQADQDEAGRWEAAATPTVN